MLVQKCQSVSKLFPEKESQSIEGAIHQLLSLSCNEFLVKKNHATVKWNEGNKPDIKKSAAIELREQSSVMSFSQEKHHTYTLAYILQSASINIAHYTIDQIHSDKDHQWSKQQMVHWLSIWWFDPLSGQLFGQRFTTSLPRLNYILQLIIGNKNWTVYIESQTLSVVPIV